MAHDSTHTNRRNKVMVVSDSANSRHRGRDVTLRAYTPSVEDPTCPVQLSFGSTKNFRYLISKQDLANLVAGLNLPAPTTPEGDPQ